MSSSVKSSVMAWTSVRSRRGCTLWHSDLASELFPDIAGPRMASSWRMLASSLAVDGRGPGDVGEQGRNEIDGMLEPGTSTYSSLASSCACKSLNVCTTQATMEMGKTWGSTKNKVSVLQKG